MDGTGLNSFLTGLCCLSPALLVGFGFWAGRGFPGWPWKIAKRARAAQYYKDEY